MNSEMAYYDDYFLIVTSIFFVVINRPIRNCNITRRSACVNWVAFGR